VRGRATFLEFQSDCQRVVDALTRHSEVDIQSVLLFAKDFRKLCPVQSPENESGYSEQELQEIQVLVDGQCTEMEVLSGQWKDRILKLQEQQKHSMKIYDEFIDKYNKSVQAVAMAEGLGQKYGAPRRRAQEKIRTEISRDEKRAGRVDELLAEIEFFASETNRLEEKERDDDMTVVTSQKEKDAGSAIINDDADNSNFEMSSSPSNFSAKKRSVTICLPTSNAHKSLSGIRLVESTVALNKLFYAWHTVRSLREKLVKRVNFLQVQGQSSAPSIPATDVFPWINESRFAECFSLTPTPFALASTPSKCHLLLLYIV
jgi:hypothetical protein